MEREYEAWIDSQVGDRPLIKAAFEAGWKAALAHALGTCETRTDIEGLVAGAFLGEVTVLIGKARYKELLAMEKLANKHLNMNLCPEGCHPLHEDADCAFSEP